MFCKTSVSQCRDLRMIRKAAFIRDLAIKGNIATGQEVKKEELEPKLEPASPVQFFQKVILRLDTDEPVDLSSVLEKDQRWYASDTEFCSGGLCFIHIQLCDGHFPVGFFGKIVQDRNHQLAKHAP